MTVAGRRKALLLLRACVRVRGLKNNVMTQKMRRVREFTYVPLRAMENSNENGKNRLIVRKNDCCTKKKKDCYRIKTEAAKGSAMSFVCVCPVAGKRLLVQLSLRLCAKSTGLENEFKNKLRREPAKKKKGKEKKLRLFFSFFPLLFANLTKEKKKKQNKLTAVSPVFIKRVHRCARQGMNAGSRRKITRNEKRRAVRAGDFEKRQAVLLSKAHARGAALPIRFMNVSALE